MQARALTTLGIFPNSSNPGFLPSFADDLVNLDHSLDAILIELFKHIDMSKSLQPRFNPEPTSEKSKYDSLASVQQQEMLFRNILLLSRLFIRNAKIMNLVEQFADKEQINILDLGCGNAPNLLGILAMFGVNRVNYVGVDVYRPCIEECYNVYGKLKSHAKILFLEENAKTFLKSPKNMRKFDLVLIQHPNLRDEIFKPIFTEIILQAQNAVATGGLLYSTFYSQSEADYFRERILPHMPQMQGSNFMQSNAYDERAKHAAEGVLSSPENFICISPQLNLVPVSVPGIRN
jgi:hypothetical protein